MGFLSNKMLLHKKKNNSRGFMWDECFHKSVPINNVLHKNWPPQSVVCFSIWSIPMAAAEFGFEREVYWRPMLEAAARFSSWCKLSQQRRRADWFVAPFTPSKGSLNHVFTIRRICSLIDWIQLRLGHLYFKMTLIGTRKQNVYESRLPIILTG